jgi:hypothetical protein
VACAVASLAAHNSGMPCLTATTEVSEAAQILRWDLASVVNANRMVMLMLELGDGAGGARTNSARNKESLQEPR